MKGKNERRGPLGKVEQNRFAAALDALRVTKGREGDAFVAAIDLSPVVEVLGAGVGEKGRIEFRLTPDQEVIISHPPTESRGNGSPTRTDAGTYPWKGELPTRQPYAPPKTGRRETPISALLRLAAYRGGLWPELRSRTHAAATRLWREVWREIAEAMNQRALAHANRFGLDWERYRLLCRRPDLCAFLDTAPGVGPLIEPLPEGMSWEEMVARLVAFPGGGRKEGWGAADYPPVFFEWVRRVPYAKEILPNIEDYERIYRGEGLKGCYRRFVWDVARAAKVGVLSVEGLERLTTPMQWLILNTAMMGKGDQQAKRLLTDPKAGESAFIRTFGPVQKGDPVWVQEGLRWLGLWDHDVQGTVVELAHWAEKLGKSKIVNAIRPPIELKRLDTACRRVRRTRELKRLAGVKEKDRSLVATHAPTWAVAEIVGHPDFKWNERMEKLLLARKSCRWNPKIRAVLIERITTESGLLALLRDRRTEETRRIWSRLAEISPRAAVEFLKEEGFDLRAGWRVEDLTPLFRAGGEITIEGALLVSELKQKLERGHTGNEPTCTPTPTRRNPRR